MEFSLCSTSLIIFLVSLSGIDNTEGSHSRRKPLHPQAKYCESDWVVYVRIKDISLEEEIIMEGARERINPLYQVKIRMGKILKATPEAEIALKENLTIWTYGVVDIHQGQHMRRGQTWILGGSMKNGKPYMKSHALNMPYMNLKADQRLGFRAYYQLGCDCKISKTDDGKSCVWDSAGGRAACQENYGMCLNQGSKGCSWKPSFSYNKCMEGL